MESVRLEELQNALKVAGKEAESVRILQLSAYNTLKIYV